jgi:hypothetical protein
MKYSALVIWIFDDAVHHGKQRANMLVHEHQDKKPSFPQSAFPQPKAGKAGMTVENSRWLHVIALW